MLFGCGSHLDRACSCKMERVQVRVAAQVEISEAGTEADAVDLGTARKGNTSFAIINGLPSKTLLKARSGRTCFAAESNKVH